MRQTALFGKTLRTAPKDEQSVNAQLLERGGYVQKLMAGVYSYLPLGFQVLKRIESIIREEMESIGAQELLLPALHPKENWVVTGRWSGPDPIYRVQDESGREFALGSTHEEVITPLVGRDIASYRDLPFALYQFQTKFRAELRAKSGVLRGREFIMKDLYSFHATEADLDTYYEQVLAVYRRIFERTGIGETTLLTYASGGTFAKYSHEFQTLTTAGEDTIYVCDTCTLAINEEILADQPACPTCKAPTASLRREKAIEVGNIFKLKTKYSAPFDVHYTDEHGVAQPVIMGCYGIGLGRLMGAIVEVHHTDAGIVWPAAVAPFDCHIIAVGGDAVILSAAEQLYNELRQRGVRVLFDDRDLSAGTKFADADLIGIPLRLVVSAKTVAAGKHELRNRVTDETEMIGADIVVADIVRRTSGV